VHNICIFEDELVENFYPLTYARPVFDLVVGFDTLFSKCSRYFDYANITLHCREALKGLVKLKFSGTSVNHINSGSACLFINGRVILTQALFDFLSTKLEENYLIIHMVSL
jgi:hypothetical protein